MRPDSRHHLTLTASLRKGSLQRVRGVRQLLPWQKAFRSCNKRIYLTICEKSGAACSLRTQAQAQSPSSDLHPGSCSQLTAVACISNVHHDSQSSANESQLCFLNVNVVLACCLGARCNRVVADAKVALRLIPCVVCVCVRAGTFCSLVQHGGVLLAT